MDRERESAGTMSSIASFFSFGSRNKRSGNSSHKLPPHTAAVGNTSPGKVVRKVGGIIPGSKQQCRFKFSDVRGVLDGSAPRVRRCCAGMAWAALTSRTLCTASGSGTLQSRMRRIISTRARGCTRATSVAGTIRT